MNSKQQERMAREQDLSGFDAQFVEAAFKVAGEAVVSGYQKIESAVVGGYKKIETGAVEGFGKVVDKCVETMFAKEGESVEDARARLSGRG